MAILLLATTVYGALTASKTVVSTGRIIASNVSIGVYSDSGCSHALSAINWGELEPGKSINFVLWINNSGTTNLTLTMETNGWSPSTASQGIMVNWNRQNTVLAPNQAINATITLTVSPSIDSNISIFSYNTTITGTNNV